MRVYGSSPLYNYVELVFRSKRLFIASVVIASLAVVTVAALRAGTYTASTLVLMSGSQEAGTVPMSEDQRGTVKYKLNILNLVMKDPGFYKDAFKQAGLDRGMSDDQFDTFCKEARAALSPSTGDNVLEISCRWKDRRAEDIVNAFYSLYARRVLDDETVLSQKETKLMHALLDDYSDRVGKLEKRIVIYQQGHTHDPLTTPDNADTQYLQMVQTVKGHETQLKMAQQQFARVNEYLKKTPKTITQMTLHGSQKLSDPRYALLQGKQLDLQTSLEDLKTRYTDAMPIVRKTQADLDRVNQMLAAMDKPSKGKDKKGPKIREEEAINPQWQTLQALHDNMAFQLAAMQSQLDSDRDEVTRLDKRAYATPMTVYNYNKMSSNLELYRSILSNLKSKLESAQMAEKRDREYHLAEMQVVVPAKAEPDVVGSKSALFLAAGPLLGLIVAFAFSLFAESMDHSLRTPIEVEKHLGKPVLAVLPRMDSPKDARRRLGGAGEARPTLPSS